MMYKSTIFIIFLLFSSAAALTTYSFTATNSTSEAQLNFVPLGTLASTDVITFLMEFPNPATGANPTQFYMALLDNAKAQLSPQPSGFGSSNMSNINFSGSNTLTWTVSTAGAYYVVIGVTSMAASLVPYHLTVTNSNGGLIVKEGDFVRQAYMDVIELASFQSTYSILLSGPIAPVLRQVANETFTTVTPTSYNTSKFTYSNLTAGSYVIQALFFSLQTITYQSDSFNCPSYYDPNFPFTSQQVLQTCNYTAPPGQLRTTPPGRGTSPSSPYSPSLQWPAWSSCSSSCSRRVRPPGLLLLWLLRMSLAMSTSRTRTPPTPIRPRPTTKPS